MLLLFASLLLVTRGKDFYVLLSADSLKNANFLVINVEIIFGYLLILAVSQEAMQQECCFQPHLSQEMSVLVQWWSSHVLLQQVD